MINSCSALYTTYKVGVYNFIGSLTGDNPI